jgi:hypothetical protein
MLMETGFLWVFDGDAHLRPRWDRIFGHSHDCSMSSWLIELKN